MSRSVVAVLSGGGAKAAAHLGALEVLARDGIVPTHYVGTSMGAVIGGGLAAGLSISEVVGRLAAIRRNEVAALDRTVLLKGLFAQALFRGSVLRQTLERLLPVRTFAELRLPLTVTAVDLDTGELLRFGAGGLDDVPLPDVMYASCALPVLYPPAALLGRRLADGGLRAVVPLEVVEGWAADLVVAVDVGAGFEMERGRDQRQPPALIRAHNDSQAILMASNSRLQAALWRATAGRPPLLYVRPRVHRGETFAVDQIHSYVAAGREAAEEALASWRQERAGSG